MTGRERAANEKRRKGERKRSEWRLATKQSGRRRDRRTRKEEERSWTERSMSEKSCKRLKRDGTVWNRGGRPRLVGRRSPRCRPEKTRRKKEIRESRRLLGGRNGEEQESGG